MEKGINAATADFRADIIHVINECGLPHCIIRAELSEVLLTVRQLEKDQIVKERQLLQQELAAEKENTQAPADQPDAATEQED